jgi:hypothetical protein
MGKKSKKDGGDPSKEVQWTSVMDDALVDVLLYQLSIGVRVDETFNSRAYDEVVKELVAKFDMDINKDKVKNRQKTLIFFFGECYNIFKEVLSGFGWNDSLSMWTAEPEVWEPLIMVNYNVFMSFMFYIKIKYMFLCLSLIIFVFCFL